MNKFLLEFMNAAKQAPRLYFSPLIGAVKETRDAWDDAMKNLQLDTDQGKQVPASGDGDTRL